MSLLSDDLRSRLPPLHAQEAEDEPMVYACFFLPGTWWRWYVIEGEPQGEDFLFFGCEGCREIRLSNSRHASPRSIPHRQTITAPRID